MAQSSSASNKNFCNGKQDRRRVFPENKKIFLPSAIKKCAAIRLRGRAVRVKFFAIVQRAFARFVRLHPDFRERRPKHFFPIHFGAFHFPANWKKFLPTRPHSEFALLLFWRGMLP